MALRVIWHPVMLKHNAGIGHPEAPTRLEAVVSGVMGAKTLGEITLHEAEPVDEELLRQVHDPSYVRLVWDTACRGGGQLDADTAVSRHSFEAASRSAGAAIRAAESALDGVGAFAAVRPPGHHATADRAMGFCIFNSIVVAAYWALAFRGLERVLIVDWDVHHGNGTQSLVQSDHRIRYVSMHQWPLYPGTGGKKERGVGNIFNIPLPAGQPRARYVSELNDGVEAAARDWSPELILISAGFDGLAGDPLGGFTLEPEDYAGWVAGLRRFGAPIASVLEGGYMPERLTKAVVAHLEELAC